MDYSNNIKGVLTILDSSQIKIVENFSMIYIYFSTNLGKQIKITCERCPTENKKVIDLEGESKICEPTCSSRHTIDGTLDIHIIDSRNIPSVGDGCSLSYHMEDSRAKLKYYIKKEWNDRRIITFKIANQIECKNMCPKLNKYREIEFEIISTTNKCIIKAEREKQEFINATS